MKKLLVCLAATLFISPAAYALQSAADVAAGIGNNSADKPPVEVRKDANESATNETLRAQDGDDLKLRKRPGRAMLEDDNTTGSNRATDYNSSRSNRTVRGSSLDEDSDNDGLTDAVTGGTRATDYNSSRSNKSYGAASLDEDSDDDGQTDAVTGGTRATDYNSSRSNKSLGAVSLDEDDDGDGLADTAKIRSNVAPPF